MGKEAVAQVVEVKSQERRQASSKAEEHLIGHLNLYTRVAQLKQLADQLV